MTGAEPHGLNAKVRVAAAPAAPVLTVVALYVQGPSETPFAECSWHKTAQHVHFPIAELEAAK